MSASTIKAAIVTLLTNNFTGGQDYNGSTLQNVTNQWLRYIASTRTPQAVVRDMSWHEEPLAAGKVNQPVRRRDYQFQVRVVWDGSQDDSDTFDTLIDNIVEFFALPANINLQGLADVGSFSKVLAFGLVQDADKPEPENRGQFIRYACDIIVAVVEDYEVN